jgi:hypothetical protein
MRKNQKRALLISLPIAAMVSGAALAVPAMAKTPSTTTNLLSGVTSGGLLSGVTSGGLLSGVTGGSTGGVLGLIHL